MSDSISKNEASVLQVMQCGVSYAAAELTAALGGEAPSPATLRRVMQRLVHIGYVEQFGTKRATRYQKTVPGALFTPYELERYYVRDDMVRSAQTGYQFGYLETVPDSLLTPSMLRSLHDATTRFVQRNASASPGVRARELERFVVEFSWKSSAIEGNTYSLLDTELLVREGLEAAGHRKEEAVMILNHKRALEYVRNSIRETHLERKHIEHLHRLLVEGLGVAEGLRRGEVGIVGTAYRPPSLPTQLEEEMDVLCARAQDMTDPYSQALLLLVGLSYLQPFEDGNKRTARLVANAVLLRQGLAPISYRDTDVRVYRESMLLFCEQLSIVPMRDIFVRQFEYACEHYLVSG